MAGTVGARCSTVASVSLEAVQGPGGGRGGLALARQVWAGIVGGGRHCFSTFAHAAHSAAANGHRRVSTLSASSIWEASNV